MNNTEFVKALIERGSNADKGYFEYAHLVAVTIDDRLHEQLGQLVNGPVWDGDVISKSDRGELFDLGLAIRVCVKGEQGYTGATDFAYSVWTRMNEIRLGKVAA